MTNGAIKNGSRTQIQDNTNSETHIQQNMNILENELKTIIISVENKKNKIKRGVRVME